MTSAHAEIDNIDRVKKVVRKLLGDRANSHKYILTIPGKGYHSFRPSGTMRAPMSFRARNRMSSAVLCLAGAAIELGDLKFAALLDSPLFAGRVNDRHLREGMDDVRRYLCGGRRKIGGHI